MVRFLLIVMGAMIALTACMESAPPPENTLEIRGADIIFNGQHLAYNGSFDPWLEQLGIPDYAAEGMTSDRGTLYWQEYGLTIYVFKGCVKAFSVQVTPFDEFLTDWDKKTFPHIRPMAAFPGQITFDGVVLSPELTLAEINAQKDLPTFKRAPFSFTGGPHPFRTVEVNDGNKPYFVEVHVNMHKEILEKVVYATSSSKNCQAQPLVTKEMLAEMSVKTGSNEPKNQ